MKRILTLLPAQEDMLAGRCPDADVSVTRGRRSGSFTDAGHGALKDLLQDWALPDGVS